MQNVTPFLMFKHSGKEAINYYLSIFKDSNLQDMICEPNSDKLLYGSFSLGGQKLMAMDGGEYFNFSEGMSLFVNCNDQHEVDYYWQALGNGGEYQQCGWLKDKYGVSWQIVPKQLGQLMMGQDKEKSARVMQAMLKMTKIDIALLQDAANGN